MRLAHAVTIAPRHRLLGRVLLRRFILLLSIGVLGVGLVVPAVSEGGRSGTFVKRGTVQRIVDGDTIEVRLVSGRRERIRLIGIDTPELRPPGCFGAEARAAAHRLAYRKRVRIVGDQTQATRDRYGRLLAYVVLPSGTDLGRQLIAGGFGRVYVYSRPFVRLAGYRAVENQARSLSRGLWRGCSVPAPLPPPGPPPPPPAGNCHASYPTVCIPPAPPDLDCGEVSHRNFHVRHDVSDPDPHGFDGDRDNVGCET